MNKSFSFVATSVCILAACSGLENPASNNATDSEVQKIIFEAPVIKDGDIADTRAGAVPQSDGTVNFAWEATDTIGVYPNSGSQVYFLPGNGVGTSSVEFDGGGWAMKANSAYVSYYPFVGNIYLKRNEIPVSFVGQKQTGTEGDNGVFNGARYILATNPTTATNGVLRFTYNTLNTIINIKATLPAGTYTSATLIADEPLFVEEGTYDMADQTIVGKKFSKTLEIELEDFTLASSATVPIYIMSAPIDLSGKEVTVRIQNAAGDRYKCVKSITKRYDAGFRYGLVCDMKKEAEIINFSDSEVKRICVENWDTDGDGELDKDEAAAVVDLGLVFVGNKIIVSFDELQYFTGLTEICDYCFSGCSNFSSIVIPDSVTRIGPKAFNSCKLSSFNIPDGVTLDVGNDVSFSVNIETLVIPGCTINGCYVFGGSISSILFSGPITHYGQPNIIYDNAHLVLRPTSLSFAKDFSYSTNSSYGLGMAMGGLNYGGNVESIVVSPENPDYDSRNDCNAVIRTSTNTLLLGCKNTVIPEDVTAIGDWAFNGDFTTVTVPEQVSQIGSDSFVRIWNLTSLIVLPTTPPTLSGGYLDFRDSSSITIYVPSGSVDAYKTAAGWSYYADRIFSLEGGTTPGSGDGGDD